MNKIGLYGFLIMTWISAGASAGAELRCEDVFAKTILAGPAASAPGQPAANSTIRDQERAASDRDARAQDPQTKTLRARTVQVLRSMMGGFPNLGTRPFSKALFRDRVEFYRAHLSDLTDEGPAFRIPTNAEERLALFEVLSQNGGPGLDGLVSWADAAQQKELNAFARSLSQRRFSKGFRESEANSLFAKIYLMSHVDPRYFREIIKKPLSESFVNLVRERAEMELGRTNFVAALKNLGLIRAPDRIEELKRWTQVNAPELELARTIGLNAASFGVTGFLARPPDVRKLFQRSRFSEASLLILRDKGWVAAQPYLMREAGISPQAELAMAVGSRIMSAVLIGIVVSNTAPMLLHSALPPNYADDAGFVDLVKDIYQYWFGAAYAYLHPDQLPRGGAAPSANTLSIEGAPVIPTGSGVLPNTDSVDPTLMPPTAFGVSGVSANPAPSTSPVTSRPDRPSTTTPGTPTAPVDNSAEAQHRRDLNQLLSDLDQPDYTGGRPASAVDAGDSNL